MGWWEIGGDDVVGDAPLDMMGNALTGLARERTAAGKPKPEFRDVLTATAAELGVDLRARTDDRNTITIGSNEGGAGRDVVAAIREVFSGATREYEEAIGRPARSTELLALVSTVVGAAPERYLSDGNGLGLLGISVLDDPSQGSGR